MACAVSQWLLMMVVVSGGRHWWWPILSVSGCRGQWLSPVVVVSIDGLYCHSEVVFSDRRWWWLFVVVVIGGS